MDLLIPKNLLLFKQNKSLKCKRLLQEISFWVKWNIFNSVYGQSFIAAYLKYPEVKFIAGYFDRNENSMFKWNPPKRIYTCKFFIKSKTVHQKIKTKIVHVISRAIKTNVKKGLIIESFFCSLNLLRWVKNDLAISQTYDIM